MSTHLHTLSPTVDQRLTKGQQMRYLQGMRILLLLSLICLTSCAGWSSAVFAPNGAYREKWRKQAYEGDKIAQYHYGNSWCCGTRPIASQKNASHWLCKSARQGYAPAQKRVGDMWRGEKQVNIKESKVKLGIMQENNRIAYAWYDLAAEQGYQPAIQSLEEILPLISDEEIRESIKMQAMYPHLLCEMRS